MNKEGIKVKKKSWVTLSPKGTWRKAEEGVRGTGKLEGCPVHAAAFTNSWDMISVKSWLCLHNS